MLVIAARQSHLARLQALTVGKALVQANPQLKIKYHFRESLGDKNLNDPLWKMPEKGVFTEDFIAGLQSGEFDMVVHSWKDLPMDDRPGMDIVATMPREDARDLLLVKKSYLAKGDLNNLRVFSSSPRRILNITQFLKKVWPHPLKDVSFHSVRGNMPTRLRKLHETEDIDGLIVAKAAFDRLISAVDTFSENTSEIVSDKTEVNSNSNANSNSNLKTSSVGVATSAISPEFLDLKEWADVKNLILPLVQNCEWMVLPLSENPTAAAQGALAIETMTNRKDIIDLLKPLHCEKTFQAVQWERKILKNYGGGCHQAIGVSVVGKEQFDSNAKFSETVAFVRGQTTQGETLKEIQHKNNSLYSSKLLGLKFAIPQSEDFFERVNSDDKNHKMNATIESAEALFVTRANALPDGYKPKAKQIVWAAGVKTWMKLAQKGIWVHGSSDSMGFIEPNLTAVGILNPLKWSRLTHEGVQLNEQSSASGSLSHTYSLKVKEKSQVAFENAEVYYWKSGSLFEQALKYFPEIINKKHCCGFGETSQTLKKHLTPLENLFYFYDEEDFKHFVSTQK